MMRDVKSRCSLKHGAWFSALVIAALLFAGCSTKSGGDVAPRQLAGTLEDWPGGAGTVQARLPWEAEPLIGGPMNSQNAFNLTLPATLPDERLISFTDLSAQLCGGLTVSPEDAKGYGIVYLEVLQDDEVVGRMYQSSIKLPNGPAPAGTVIATRLYVDKAARLGGSCGSIPSIDLKLQAGWNIVIAKVIEVTQGMPRLELSNGTVPADVSWHLFNYKD